MDLPEPDNLLTRYVLGETTPLEKEQVEEQYLADESFFGRLLQAEESLIIGYLRDKLPSATRQRFEAYYLATPERRERAETIARLLDYANPRWVEPIVVQPRLAWWRRALGVPVWGTAALVLLAFLFCGIWWYSGENNPAADNQIAQATPAPRPEILPGPPPSPIEVTPNPQESPRPTIADNPAPLPPVLRSAKNGPPLQPVAPVVSKNSAPPVVNPRPAQKSPPVLRLTASATRSAGPVNKDTLEVLAGTPRAEVHVSLDPPIYASYQVTLQPNNNDDNDNRLLAERRLTPEHDKLSGYFLNVRLPLSEMASGSYLVKTEGYTKEGVKKTTESYFFNLNKR